MTLSPCHAVLPANPDQTPHPANVMIVDDIANNLTLLRFVLEADGYQVELEQPLGFVSISLI